MAEKKITKVEKLTMIRDILAGDGYTEVTEEAIMLIDFVDEQIEQIQSKAEKAKQRAAEKKAEGDALRNTIQSLMTNEWQSIDEIFNQIEDEGVTRSKITARLTQLIKAGVIEKDSQKGETGNKQMVYRLIEA
jgi:uncharacterized protein YrzB (UPF0473 family)